MGKGLKKIHLRVAIGGGILMVAFLAWMYMMDGMTYFARAPR
ncbi:MAG: hypothetical protein ACYCVL_05760 [Gemmatimonadaceae bacterium]